MPGPSDAVPKPSASTSGSAMSSTLWAHLLNKDAVTSGTGSKTGSALLAGFTPPVTADRNGTSVRMLLHDTQAMVEKFSERVDKLITEAEGSRHKLLARNEEVNEEVERLVRQAVQEQVGRTETTLQSSIREPAQAPALAELRLFISTSLDALGRRVEAVQSLVHINTEALHAIKDQQSKILTAIIPLLPMLQKVPLHIASTEAALKEDIRKFVVPPVSSAQLTSTSSISGAKKRRTSKSADRHTPSPSVVRRKRIRTESSCTGQQQLPSPKSSRDSLLNLTAANHHRTVGDALQFGVRSASRSISTAQPPNPGQRSSMQPPTPRVVPIMPSQIQSVSLSERPAQLTLSSVSHKKLTTLETTSAQPFARSASSAHSVTTIAPYHLNNLKDPFKVPSQFHIHTPLRTGSKYTNGQPMRSLVPPLSSVGFSARRGKRFIPITDEDDDEISDG